MSTPDPMAEIRASFFIECEELLESLQDGLETMAEDTGDLETINVVFRAVHSIKGGAGAFGLEGLVRFAHRYETVLDAVRSNTLVADGMRSNCSFVQPTTCPIWCGNRATKVCCPRPREMRS